MKNDVAEIGQQCDAAIEAGNEGEIRSLIEKLIKLSEHDDFSGEPLCFLFYFLGNLHTSLAVILNEDWSGWRSDSFPIHRVEAINFYRQSLKLAKESGVHGCKETETNLANEIAHQRRNIECLDIWCCDLLPRQLQIIHSLPEKRISPISYFF